jgi:hypothetical protein
MSSSSSSSVPAVTSGEMLARTVLVVGAPHAGTRSLVDAWARPHSPRSADERAYEAQLAALSRSHAPVHAACVRRPLPDVGIDMQYTLLHVPALDFAWARRYESTAAIVYVYDATSSTSLGALEQVLLARADAPLHVTVRVLVGNKADVLGAERTAAAAADLAARYGFTMHERCSARTLDNVDATLARLGEKLLAEASREFVARQAARDGSAMARALAAVTDWLTRPWS